MLELESDDMLLSLLSVDVLLDDRLLGVDVLDELRLDAELVLLDESELCELSVLVELLDRLDAVDVLELLRLLRVDVLDEDWLDSSATD